MKYHVERQKTMENSKLYKRIISEENIYLAIYKIDSYIFEKELLNEADIRLLYALQDKFDQKLIRAVINKVKKIIERIMLGEEFFETKVYLRPKKSRKNENKITFRPLHTARLCSQIAMVAMFNGLIYDEINQAHGKIQLNELNRIIPANFYGNIISNRGNELYMSWKRQYSKYSKDITESYSQYAQSGEYKYEVNLDIKDFFPSIDPDLVYAIIYEKLSIKYKGVEKECFKQVLLKLLYYKLETLHGCEKEYYGEHYNDSWEKGYCKGIPQGLPISCFWANIIMVEISKIFEEKIQGRSYYYVDDVVIYTNFSENGEIKTKGQDEFEDLISGINNKITQFCSEKVKKIEHPKPIGRFKKQCNYEIVVHKDEKSSFSKIDGYKTGQVNLNMLSKIISVGAAELMNIFSDSDDITLLNKLEVLEISVSKEIERIKRIIDKKKTKDRTNGNIDYKHYKKILIRMRKFIRFRIMLLQDKTEIEIHHGRLDKILSALSLNTDKENKGIDKFFEMCDEDIFLAEFMYILRNIKDEKRYKEVKEALTNFNKHIFSDKEDVNQVSYFYRLLEGIETRAPIMKKKNMRYLSLERNVKEKIERVYVLNNNTRIDFLGKMLGGLVAGEQERKPGNIYDLQYYMPEHIPCDLVNQLTDEIRRMVLNSVTSLLINVNIDDNATPQRVDNRPLTYLELRTITYIRNKIFDFKGFIEFANKLNYQDTSTIDYSLFQVLDYFRKFVRYPKMIDNLIQAHKYTVDMWKQGSKFLHFYTLHNQEHAIEVIKAIQKVVRSIEYIQITSRDYYILYMSCYLHDISMIIYPKVFDVFKSEKNTDANLIYSAFKVELHKMKFNLALIEDALLRELLINYYSKIDSFFEGYVRSTHAKDSANYIKKTADLYFIQSEIKDIIAEVTEAHGYKPVEVYGVKSTAKDSLVSKKYLKILLRLGDLLDMSENRITDAILANNIDHMSLNTQFHWISHKIITGYDIETKYENKKIHEELLGNESYLHKENMLETIIFKIKLNIKHTESRGYKEACTYKFLAENDTEENTLFIKIRDTKKDKTAEDAEIEEQKDCKDRCNFICKWMSKKNAYLYEELYALQKYLRRLSNVSYFNTNIIVELKMENKIELDKKYYGIISKQL